MIADPQILIVEDNALMAEGLRAMLEDEGYTVAGHLRRGESLAEWFQENDADLLLMDIRLDGEMDGIEAVAGLNRYLRRPVIFLSAFEDRPLLERAFATQPAAYLTKPFKRVDLLNAVRAALSAASVVRAESPAALPSQESVISPSQIFIRTHRRFEKLPTQSILWLHAHGSYTDIITTHERHTVTVPLGALLERLNHPDIRRVHRSYAVNVQAVTAFDENFVFIGETAVPISRAYFREVKDLFRLI